MLSRDQIIAKKNVIVSVLSVPELGGEVGVKAFSVREKDRLDHEIRRRKEDLSGVRVVWLAMVLCDEAGEHLFSREDTTLLEELPVAAAERILKESRRISGMDVYSVDDAEKNF